MLKLKILKGPRLQLRAKNYRQAGIALWILLATSCAHHIETRSAQLCKNCQPLHLLSSNAIPMVAYTKNTQSADPYLHVYLEGDGRPFLRNTLPAINPNSEQLLALQLMQLDPAPSIYLNRPCYGLNTLPQDCTSRRWTTERYSEETVQHLNAALNEALTKIAGHTQLLLIGHSGGGTLAMLMAQRRHDVKGLVTLAGNLDTEAWTQHHNYTPLFGSLNPAKQAVLPAGIQRWHYAGQEDSNIPSALIKASCQQDKQAQCFTLPAVSHTQGWLEAWPQLLLQVTATLHSP